jgi:5-methylthioadenosine/S-adenosylhomocysteine deaminase
MSIDFDPGYGDQPFKTLVQNYPGEDVYPPGDFRTEWGPIFHRGRLDGSARVLMIGQDPAQHEAIVRRILVGEAGQRAQGFLAKLGITKSYVLINTYLYSVLGQGGGNAHKADAKIAAYRHKWLDALLVNSQVEVVVALGTLAESAWNQYKATPAGNALSITFAKITHPTFPESSGKNDKAKVKAATKTMLTNWNAGLATLFNALTQRDTLVLLVPYGDDFKDGEKVDIPDVDFPAGLPAWMRSGMAWAARTGAEAEEKRRTITIQIPKKLMPTKAAVVPHALKAESLVLTAPAAPAFPPGTDPDAEHHALIASDAAAAIEPTRFALKGRIVCMDEAGTVIPSGIVFITGNQITLVQPATSPPDSLPAGFTKSDILDTAGTIYPGLVELHNHLPYNVLGLWDVPRKYEDRNVWRRSAEYHKAVVAPMKVLADEVPLAPAIARYTECKALFGGVTTSQGITLISSSVTSKYRGLVRNVEQVASGDGLPGAKTNVSDVEGVESGLDGFAEQLAKADARKAAYLHHLAEGTNDVTHKHFERLQRSDRTWVISPALVGIHSTVLNDADLDVMAAHGGAIVWSPLSNLLLYGQTARIKSAVARGIRIGLGSDWSPSGSKNLLGELKAARAASDHYAFGLSDRDLVVMATSGAAAVARWDGANGVGQIVAGKKADLLVLDGADGSANSVYSKLINAKETDVRLVVIDGVKRYGTPTLMKKVNGPTDSVMVGREKRVLNLNLPAGSDFPTITYSESKATLTKAMKDLPAIAQSHETGKPHPMAAALSNMEKAGGGLRILLDELVDDPGPASSPPLPAAMAAAARAIRAQPLSATVKKGIELDPPTAVDDDDFLDLLLKEKNPPKEFLKALKKLY